jgi:hypothetical protein
MEACRSSGPCEKLRLAALQQLVHELTLENARLRRRNAAAAAVMKAAASTAASGFNGSGGGSGATTLLAVGPATSLPDELWMSIGRFLSARDLSALLCSSRRFSVTTAAAVEALGGDSSSLPRLSGVAAAAPFKLPPLYEAARAQTLRLSEPVAVWAAELLSRGSADPRAWPRLLWEAEGAAGARIPMLRFTTTSPQVMDCWWSRLRVGTVQGGDGSNLSAEDIIRESSAPPRWLRRVSLSHDGTVATGQWQLPSATAASQVQTAVCDGARMYSGRHYCEFDLLQPGSCSSVGIVGAEYDPDVHDPPRRCGEKWAGWMLDTSLGLVWHDTQPLNHPGGLAQSETVGLQVDLDAGTIDVIFNGKHRSRRRWDRRYCLDMSASGLQQPLRWAVELGGEASIRIQAKQPSTVGR